MKTWRKLSLRRCQNESNCGAWISTLSQNAPERMECCCRSLPETEEAEKALAHFAEELYQSVSVEEKADALYNSLYEKWAAGDQFEKCFVPKLRTMLHNALRSVAENKELRAGIDESARALGGNILEEEYPHISSVTADILKNSRIAT